MEPPVQLEALAKAASKRLESEPGAPEVLPFAKEALSLIAAHPELRSEFESRFLEMPTYAPPEFIEVCMHALRWPVVKDEFSKRHRDAVLANDWRREPVYRGYLQAFAEDWEDAKDLYPGFFGPSSS